ncbi:hypothetical protein [Natrarchaeobius chitinivorans]|uniref:DUF8135 domain-containing protein n=1 Tax=Natrarchaeobius chitinivorans TaxID=1679083 RepID=A0A3N6M6C6_NATCH|nr:hypothetical protein [Natrarchaeobius chitinivorans]RQG97727.1 hypothetical protein EA473_00460 [Natrarchaeobius chitinivorans]
MTERDDPLDDPLDDIASTVADRSSDAASAEKSEFDELFDREDAVEIDEERLWAHLEDGVDPDADVPESGRDVREVDKHSHCHQCEHFGSPPAVECGHDGTDILAMPTLEMFRVADCPIVRENDRLEGRDDESG